jgi:hypothetical protein
LFSLLIVCFSASTPAKNSIPTELTASIEKKWPGSKMVLAANQSEIDNNTILYKIVLNNDQIGWAYTRRVLSCRNGGCKESDSPDDRNVSHEYFEYYAVLNTQYSIIEIKVYNYAATHGEEICSKAWLKQFKGYDGSKNLRYGKDIDAISGATISGIAITEDIGSTVIMLRK